MKHFFVYSTLMAATLMAGCAKNPVTGKNELHLVSTKQEIKMGEKNYLYGQQSSGGPYNIDPQLGVYVNEVGQKLAKHSARPDLPYEFVVLNDSVPNAWAMPGGKIAVNRGLLTELDNEAELAAVLGHEITHAAARHGAKSMERQIVLQTGLIATNVALATTSKSSDSPLKNAGLMAGASVAAGLISTRYGRDAELQADDYGMEYMVKAGYDPEAAVTLQKTFVRLSEGKSSNWLKGLFASHPPSEDRVKANQEHLAKLPKNLDLGKERYQQKITKLKARVPAYKAHEEGVKALAKRDRATALKHANEAIKLEPKEALFYALKGDILTQEEHFENALKEYNQAIALDKDYYYYYQQRGLLYKKMGKKEEAKIDLKHSSEMLPTEAAHLGLMG